MKALIERCPEDLNLFAMNVVKILTEVVSSNDLMLSQHASPVFESFCRFHNDALFRGDPAYVEKFQTLVSLYLALAGGSVKGPNELQWKLVGVGAAKSVAGSVVILTPAGKLQIDSIVPLLLDCLSLDSDGSTLLLIHSQIATVESKQLSRRASVLMSTITPNDLSSEELLRYTSMQALRHFFETTTISLLKNATHATISFILKTKAPPLWSSIFLEIATRCVPVQTRFAVLTELVDQLIAVPITDLTDQLTIVRFVTYLLSSSVNMVGLSVIDILRSLLQHKLNILKSIDIDTIQPGTPAFELLAALKDCVAALASHVYYAAQTSDIISEILAKSLYPGKGLASGAVTPIGIGKKNIDMAFGKQHNGGPSTNVNISFLVDSLETIYTILSFPPVKAGGVEKSQLSISCWDGTENLLNHDNFDVRVAYARTLAVFMAHDRSPIDKGIKVSSELNVTEGSFGRILVELYHLAIDSSAHDDDYISVYKVFFAFLSNMGDHGIIRAAALSFMLEQKSSAMLSEAELGNAARIDQGLTLASISCALMYQIAAKLQSPDLLVYAKAEVKHRQELGVWYTQIDVSQSLADVLKSKPITQRVVFERDNAHTINKVDRDLVISVLNTRLRDFEPSMSQILDVNLNCQDNLPLLWVLPVPSLNPSENRQEGAGQVHRAKSLRQLNNHLHASKEDFYNISNDTNISINGDMSVYTNDGQDAQLLGVKDTAWDSESRRNGSSLRIKDLKRAASGHSIRGGPLSQPSTLSNVTNRAHSINSTNSEIADSQDSSYDNSVLQANHLSPTDNAAAVATSGPNNSKITSGLSNGGAKNDVLDVMSFLSSLNVNDNARGRLV